MELRELDFLALSSELWEWPLVGSDYKLYRYLFSNVKQYAWSWYAVYSETKQRINNYIIKGADGIETKEPQLVRTLLKK